jgi:multidrug efflux pump subunit AcrA (membrane-fusion protein)
VKEGQRVKKGELLAELDTTLAKLQLEAVKLQVANAKAEVKRVKLGSVSALTLERPEKEHINLEASKKEIEIMRERVDLMRKLYEQAAVSRAQVLELEAKLAETERSLLTSQLDANVSSLGLPESTEMAENVLQQQENLLQQRTLEFEYYHVRAPADGIVERVALHAGEFNQSAGAVGFIIAADLWFEAHFDQTGIDKIHVGDKAQVFLEAIPQGPMEGRVTRVIPIVSYSTSGPEAHQPVRVMGTGAPEWPTTFTGVIEFSPADVAQLTPGMTGFAKIEEERDALVVRRSSVTGVTGRRGILYVMRDRKSEPREVVVGDSSEEWTEIKAGIVEGEKAVISGHEDLIPDDKVTEVSAAHH